MRRHPHAETSALADRRFIPRFDNLKLSSFEGRIVSPLETVVAKQDPPKISLWLGAFGLDITGRAAVRVLVWPVAIFILCVAVTILMLAWPTTKISASTATPVHRELLRWINASKRFRFPLSRWCLLFEMRRRLT
jgi:hypothetical protein